MLPLGRKRTLRFISFGWRAHDPRIVHPDQKDAIARPLWPRNSSEKISSS